MTTAQKFVAWLVGLGAGFLVVSKPDAIWKAAQSARSLVAGSIVDVTTGKSNVRP
jgi:hypothetical protein